MKTLAFALAFLALAASAADAATDCTTRKSGGVTIATCSDSRAEAPPNAAPNVRQRAQARCR